MSSGEAATRREVTVSADEITVILGLLGVLCEERGSGDDIGELAHRMGARLQDRLRHDQG